MSEDTITFSSENSALRESMSMSCRGTTWDIQASIFFRFLLAQGFYLSEKTLGEYYLERSEEVKDLRSNSYIHLNKEGT